MTLPGRFTREEISELEEREVFVFGSNLAGIHRGGAARLAFEQFGAVWGEGIGHFGRTYAIPTKDEHVETMGIEEIHDHVTDFISYARHRSDLTFLVTQIGCGLAGYTPEEIGPLFSGAPENVVLPKSFWKHLST